MLIFFVSKCFDHVQRFFLSVFSIDLLVFAIVFQYKIFLFMSCLVMNRVALSVSCYEH